MTEEFAATEYEWTLVSFTETIHRGGVALWAWSPTRRLAQLDGLCRAFWQIPDSVVTIDALFLKVNPEDREGMMRDWMASATDPQPYSFDFRIGEGADARWISARGIGGEAGQVGDWVQAIFLDITERKRAEEAEHLLTAEMAHRVSNMFAVARALTAIVARDATSAPRFAEDLSQRFGVLHEATNLAARSYRLDQGSVKVQDLATRILAPYLAGTNIVVSVDPEAVVPPDRINDYAMIFHELATNSAKYGALAGGGSLEVRGRVGGGELTLTWEEGAASAGSAKADGSGFGSRLLKQTIERSLRGRFQRTIDGEGLHFEMHVPVA